MEERGAAAACREVHFPAGFFTPPSNETKDVSYVAQRRFIEVKMKII